MGYMVHGRVVYGGGREVWLGFFDRGIMVDVGGRSLGWLWFWRGIAGVLLRQWNKVMMVMVL